MKSSSSSSPLPHLSLRSPELQAEFIKECQNRDLSHSDDGESSVTSSSPLHSPISPFPCGSSSSSSSSSPVNRQGGRWFVFSPELLSGLKKSRTSSLRHVSAPNGLTTIFCGRGRGGQVSGPAPSTPPANQKTSP